MVFTKPIIAALAAAASVYAATGCSDDATVQNQGDATKVAGCTTLDGDLTINPQAGATLDFGSKLAKITGKLSMANDAQIQSLSFNGLGQLGSLQLLNLTSLAQLNFGNLTTVGDMDLENLGTLANFNFGQGLQTAGNVRVENVQVNDLSGISSATKIGSIILANNQYLSNINFNLTSVGTIDIGANNKNQGQNVNFPSLTTATSVTIRNSTTVSTPMLRNVAETLSLIGNTFTSYSVPNLTWAGAIVLNSNPKVTNFSFPQLLKINNTDNATLDMQNNTAYTNLNAFPKLTDVEGGVNLFGNIANYSLPALTNVAGAMNVDSSAQNVCDQVSGFGSNQTVKGGYDCKEGNPTPEGSSGSTTTGGSSSSSSSAAVPIELPSFLVSGAFAALLAFLA